jgi:hypothetical protein
MSHMFRNELARLKAAPVETRAQVLGVMAELQALTGRLLGERDAVGAELATLSRGITAVSAYAHYRSTKGRRS